MPKMFETDSYMVEVWNTPNGQYKRYFLKTINGLVFLNDSYL